MGSDGWTALAAIGAWVLAIATCYFIREQIKTTKNLVMEQNKIAREQMKVSIQIKLAEKFDSNAMEEARSLLAQQLIDKADHDDIKETVMNFFEDMGMFLRRDYLDEELIWSGFSFYIIRWWTALRLHGYIKIERGRQGEDDTIFEEFSRLYEKMLARDAKEREIKPAEVIPDHEKIEEFLNDEINLVERK